VWGSTKLFKVVQMTMVSCTNCRYYHSDSWLDTWWMLCTHPSWKDEGRILPNREDPTTPPWCPLNQPEEKLTLDNYLE